MKKKIRKRLVFLTITALIFILGLNYLLQIIGAQHDMETASSELFWQIEQIILQNSIELTNTTNDIRNQCLHRAKTASYVLSESPEHIESLTDMIHIMEMLDVDELHVFDETGRLYAGTNPEYYGMTFNSGEQISYFLPMLNDKSMSMYQELTPNTASGKMMQYAAVWMDDGSGIVQIGYEPHRIIEQTKKNELSYIFSLFATGNETTLLAIDPESKEILGSTNSEILGKSTQDLGITEKQLKNLDKGFTAKFCSEYSYCIFHRSDDVIIGRVCTTDSLYNNVNKSNIRLIFYVVIIFGAILFSISKYLDKNIVNAITKVNAQLKKISNGRLDVQVQVHTTEEFTELSGHINDMVSSLLKTTSRLELILEKDELTGLTSRRAFYRKMNELFKNPLKLGNALIFMIDSDDLKQANDTYGHEAGDKYLQKTAEILSRLSAKKRIIARLGGDEFAILIYGEASPDKMQSYIDELGGLRDSTCLTLSDGARIPVRFSMGAALYPRDGEDFHNLLKHADNEMYNDKLQRKTAR